MGSGTEEHRELSEPLGVWIAEEGFHLLNGGGGGVMAAVSRAFRSVADRRGVVVGILPGSVHGGKYRAPEGYPNAWIELPIRTHLPLSGEHGTEPMSRNHINVLTPNVIVALPGGPGTASEVMLALQYEKPVVAYLGDSGTIVGLKPETVAGARLTVTRLTVTRLTVARELEEVKRFVLEETGKLR